MRAETALWCGAALALLLCLSLPVSNPDLFWHLSAASRMFELGAIPDSDWLSYTRQGAPWTDFEWLAQLAFAGAYRWGMAGVGALKTALLLAVAGVLWRTLALQGGSSQRHASALALWAAAAALQSDARPELFSLLGFAALQHILERRRLGLGDIHFGWMAFLFGLWSNLHLGYVYGLILLFFYAVDERCRAASPSRSVAKEPPSSKAPLWAYLAAAGAGTFLQPHGWRGYVVLWEHLRDIERVGWIIEEWRGLQLNNPWHWPIWLLLALNAAALPGALRRGGAAVWAGVCLFFGAYALRHSRLAGYYVLIALPALSRWTSDRSRSGPYAAAILGMVAFLGWCIRTAGLPWGAVFDPRHVPLKAAEFLMLEQRALGGLPMYNPWGWGGYLGWRLYPVFRVFQDGRYIFHSLLEQRVRSTTPSAWASFLERYGVCLAVMENFPLPSRAPAHRPYYVAYMPEDRWALVYWDEQALVFTKRSCLLSTEGAEAWVKSREYRYLRPRDTDAVQAAQATAMGKAALGLERERHMEQSRRIAAAVPEL